MDITTLILGFVAVASLGGFIYLYLQKDAGQDKSGDLSSRIDSLNQNMTNNLNTVTQTMLEQLGRVTTQVDGRLKENAELSQKQQRSVGERLDNAGKVIKEVTASISRLEESNKKVEDYARDLSSLQDILKTPKLRGGLGELFLEELLAQIFPKGQFELQHRFKSGEVVDAVVRLRDDQMVSVDAKFPLENFKKMSEEKDEKESERMRKAFVVDVKKHIDAISKKYILTDEGTLDFALMYIPAENVYYETIIKDSSGVSISQYGLEKHVIPVSPNSFNIYLHTILMGLKGMQIEKSAREIFNNLSRLRSEFGKFDKDFELVGTHLGRAQSSYDNSEKRLGRLSDKLGKVEVPAARGHQQIEGADEGADEISEAEAVEEKSEVFVEAN